MVSNYGSISGIKLIHLANKTVLAAVSIANIVKSSLGPVGLDKMLVDEIGVNKAISVSF